MKSKIKKYISRLVVGTIASLLATTIGTIINALFKQINFWESLTNIFTAFYKFILNVLTFGIPVYIVLILIITFLIIKKKFKKISDAKKENVNLQFLNYTEDDYKSWHMKWEYEKNYQRKYEIIRLRPVCTCGCELSRNVDLVTISLYCPACNVGYDILYENDIDDCKKVIDHKIRNDYFQKNNESNE